MSTCAEPTNTIIKNNSEYNFFIPKLLPLRTFQTFLSFKAVHLQILIGIGRCLLTITSIVPSFCISSNFSDNFSSIPLSSFIANAAPIPVTNMPRLKFCNPYHNPAYIVLSPFRCAEIASTYPFPKYYVYLLPCPLAEHLFTSGNFTVGTV